MDWTFDDLQVTVASLPGGAGAVIEREVMIAGVDHFHIRLDGIAPAEAGAVQCRFRLPGVDCPCVFIPRLSAGQSVWPDYPWNGHVSTAAQDVPVQCVYGLDGGNRCTVAVDDVLHPVRIGCGIKFCGNHLLIRVTPFEGGRQPGDALTATIRLDRRAQRWERSLRDVVAWWETQFAAPALSCPDTGRLPMFSGWYAFGKDLEEHAVLANCRIAKAVGCETMFLDDGWQTPDTIDNREGGYATSGDWQPLRFPDMPAMIEKIHATGLGLILWYGVPHAGLDTQVYQRLRDAVRHVEERQRVGILDPRHPGVRQHLFDTLVAQVRDWPVDGVKLDFVGTFCGRPEGLGKDADLGTATDKLMQEVVSAMLQDKPELLIEYRQGYYGPAMQRHANMFRAVDCPNDALRNRGRTLSLRLLTRGVTVHSDMMEWHRDDPPEVAARQLLAALFSVPQVSGRLDRLPESHLAMLRFWLGWWRAHRDCLLEGELWCDSPEAAWPLVRTETAEETIIAVYDERVVTLDRIPARLSLVNASVVDAVVVCCASSLGRRRFRIRDCTGVEQAEQVVDLVAGVHALPIPVSGMAEVQS